MSFSYAFKTVLISFILFIPIIQYFSYCSGESDDLIIQIPVWSAGDYWEYYSYQELDYNQEFGDGTHIYHIYFLDNERICINDTALVNGEECYVMSIQENYKEQMTLHFSKSRTVPFDAHWFNMTGTCYRRVSDLAFVAAYSNCTYSTFGCSETADETPIINITTIHYQFSIIPESPVVTINYPLQQNNCWYLQTNLTLSYNGIKTEKNVNTNKSDTYSVSAIEYMNIELNGSVDNPDLMNVPAGSFNCYPVRYNGKISWTLDETIINQNRTAILTHTSNTHYEQYDEYYSPVVQNMLYDSGDKFGLNGGFINIGYKVDLIKFSSRNLSAGQNPYIPGNTELVSSIINQNKALYVMPPTIILAGILTCCFIIIVFTLRKKRIQVKKKYIVLKY
jgi:hypothetical protein